MDAQTTLPITPGTPPGHQGFLGPDRWWHLSFGGLAAVTLIAFTLWSFGYVEGDVSPMLLILAILFGLFMSFNIGGNDVANSFGTSVGAGTLTMKQALMVAAVFEVSGAVMAGGAVTNTVRSGIVELSAISDNALDFAFIMMAALLGAALWLLIATRRGWPVSTTHSIIGGIVGAAVTVGIVSGTGGFGMVQWGQIGQIAISWVLSPVLGAAVSFLLFGAIKRRILVYNEKAEEALRELKREEAETTERHRNAAMALNDLQQTASTSAFEDDDLVLDVPIYTKRKAERKKLEQAYKQEMAEIESKARAVDPYKALQVWVPALAAGGAAVITSMLLFKGLNNLDLGLTTTSSIMIIGMVMLVIWMAISILAKTLQNQELSRSTFILFSWMQVFTASAFAFSHGANDIANAIGPFAAVLDVLATGEIGEKAVVPPAALFAFGIALIVGLWFVGRKVIATVGTNLTRIHPASGFAAELAAAGVVMAASVLGLPVSSTHILIGAVLGIGLVNRSANWKLMRPIALAWLITIPASAAIGAVAVLVLRTVF